MCLSKITKRNPVKTSGIGYKVYRTRNVKTIGMFHEQEYVVGQSYVAKKLSRQDTSNMYVEKKYPVGFHIFTNLSSAQEEVKSRWFAKFIIVKVKYSKAFLMGKEYTNDKHRSVASVVVAKKITLLEEVK